MTDGPEGKGIDPEDELEERLRLAIRSDVLPDADEAMSNLYDLEGKVSRASDQSDVSLEEAEAEFQKRLKEIESRASVAKAERDAKLQEKARQVKSDRDVNRGLGVGMSVAYTILGVPMFGIGVGYLVDRSLGTDFWKGVGALVGATVGVAMALYILNRSQKS